MLCVFIMLRHMMIFKTMLAYKDTPVIVEYLRKTQSDKSYTYGLSIVFLIAGMCISSKDIFAASGISLTTKYFSQDMCK